MTLDRVPLSSGETESPETSFALLEHPLLGLSLQSVGVTTESGELCLGVLSSILSPRATLLGCAGQYHCRGGSSWYWLWLQMCCARVGSAFTAGWEQDSTSLALNRNLPLPGQAERVLPSMHVRGGNLAANISAMTI